MNANLPDPLAQEALRSLQAFEKAAESETVQHIEETVAKEALLSVFAFSSYVAKACIRTPSLLRELAQSHDLNRRYSSDHYNQVLQTRLETVADEGELYNLRDDPGEANNIADIDGRVTELLTSRVLDFIVNLSESTVANDAQLVEADDKMIENLRSLGYVQ